MISTFTVPLSPAARRARRTKRSSVAWLTPGILFCRMTKFYSAPFAAFLRVHCDEMSPPQTFLVASPKNKQEGPLGGPPAQCPAV